MQCGGYVELAWLVIIAKTIPVSEMFGMLGLESWLHKIFMKDAIPRFWVLRMNWP